MGTDEQRDEERAAVASAWALGLVVGVVVLGLLATAYLIGFNHGKGEGGGEPAVAGAGQKAAKPKPAPVGPGRDLFVQNCGSCHTLADAGTSGTTGPNLDDLGPDQARVQAAIQNGGTGSGIMPVGLLRGSDAEAVAKYVAGVAGQ